MPMFVRLYLASIMNDESAPRAAAPRGLSKQG
jgi:hypothetical protein